MNKNFQQEISSDGNCTCNCLQFFNKLTCQPPSDVAWNLWYAINNVVMYNEGATFTDRSTRGTIHLGLFNNPPYTFNNSYSYTPEAGCPLKNCYDNYVVPNQQSMDMCYDTLGNCNQGLNFNTFIRWIQEITAEYNCWLTACKSGMSECCNKFTANQMVFIDLMNNLNNNLTNTNDPTTFISQMKKAITDNDTENWNVSNGIVPGKTVIEKLNASTIYIPWIQDLAENNWW
jgi:hypothetical protein